MSHMKKDPKVALVLGAGGSKGIAHVGVLKVLEKNNIKIDFIVGCSMGAVIGGCYALGAKIEQMENEIKIFSRNEILDLRIPNKFGFVKGDKAEKFIRKFIAESGIDYNIPKTENTGKLITKEPMFSDCKIPFYCFATDFYKGEGVVLSRGKIIPSIRASFSIGGVFRPVKIGAKFLLDGGMISRVPVNIARALGADIVIAVDCVGPTKPIKESDIENYSDTVTRVFYMMDYAFSKDEMNSADVLISISNDINGIKFRELDKLLQIGEEVATQSVEKIRHIINNCGK